jgi:GNAT superfamily N-acetyltransferase
MDIDFKFYTSDAIMSDPDIETYKEQLIQQIKNCFNYDFSLEGITRMLESSEKILIVFDTASQKIIGYTSIIHEPVIVYDPTDTDQYEADPNFSKTYVLKKKFKNNINFFDFEGQEPDTVQKHPFAEHIVLFPTISSFCRDQDKKYKGLGTLMLDEIIKICKKDGYTKIYTVPESTKGLTDINKMDEYCGLGGHGYDNNEYYKSNMQLIKHYENIGFKILKNHHIVDICNRDTGDNYLDGDYIVLNVMYKNI